MTNNKASLPTTTQPTQEAPSSDVVEWSFDDLHIGVKGVSALKTRLIPRPPRMTNGEWYDYAKLIIAALASTAGDILKAENERLREALTPSGDTKAAYMGEFAFNIVDNLFDDDAQEFIEQSRKIYVPWTTIKEIMAFILARADARTALGSDQ